MVLIRECCPSGLVLGRLTVGPRNFHSLRYYSNSTLRHHSRLCTINLPYGSATDRANARGRYTALLAQDIGFFDKHRAAELTNRLTSDVQDFKSAFKSCCSTGLKASTQLLGSVLALYQISPSLTVLCAHELQPPLLTCRGNA